MTRNRLAIAHEVRDSLVRAEQQIDEAVIACAELVATVLRSGRDVGAATALTQPAFDRAFSALDTTARSRQAIVATHDEFARVGSIVLPNRALGGAGSKDYNELMIAGGHLSVVPAAADRPDAAVAA